MKKVLSLLIAMCMVVSLIPAAAATEALKLPADKGEEILPQAAPVLTMGIEEYPVLEMDGEMTLSCNSSEYTYVAFTPEVSGKYRFYSVSDTDTVARIYDAEMTYLYYGDDCSDEKHGHSNSRDFCITFELEGGATYLLAAKLYSGIDSSTVSEVTVHVTCGHTYTAEIDAQNGIATFTCSICGDSYSAETATLEYDGEVTVTEGEMGYPYVIFTPETSGSYRFYTGKEGSQGCDILDMNLELISDYEYENDCCDPFHGHPANERFCKIAQLEGGVTYILEPASNYETDTVTIGVTCGHAFSVESLDDDGTMSLKCRTCDFPWTAQVTTLHMGEGHEMVRTVDGYEDVYVAFTAEHAGDYLFYSTGSLDPWAYVYDSDLNYLEYINNCLHYPDPHTDGENFCENFWMEAGETLILMVRSYADAGETYSLHVDCWHEYTREYDQQTGMVTTACIYCGEGGTEACPELTYGEEIVLPCNAETYTYATFIPETSGKYCIYAGGTDSAEIWLYDENMEWLDHNTYCWQPSHDHNSCITMELEAGEAYLVKLQLSQSGLVFDRDVSVGVSCGHTYTSEITQEATCAQPGVRTYTCTICGDTYEEEVTVPHSYVTEIIDMGTCSEPGTMVHTCDVCGHAETEEYRVAHDYEVEVIVEATCQEDGLERYTCVNCGHSYDQDTWEGHDYVEEITQEGSCTQIEIVTITCTLCGESWEEENWYRHDYQEVTIKEATCTEYGETGERCTLCGEENYSWEVEPNGHSYGADLKCAACSLAAPTSGVWSDDEGRSLNWTWADGVLTITGQGEMPELELRGDWESDYYVDTTPWKGIPVREAVIGEGITNVTAALFENRTELEKVTLPSTVTSIGVWAFRYCESLTGIELPEGLALIETSAFWGCSSLTAVEFPASLTRVAYGAFANCDLRQVHIPATLTDLDHDSYNGVSVFGGNGQLTSITVDENNSVYCVDDQGVLYSKDMTQLLLILPTYVGTYTLPASVTTLYGYAFSDCSELDTILVEEGNPKFQSRNGMLYIKASYNEYWDANDNRVYGRLENILYACPPAKELGAYTIDAETSALADGAFRNCVKLTELTIPVTCTVNASRFSLAEFDSIVAGCTSLKAVWFEEGHEDCFSDENGLVYNAVSFFDGFSMDEYAPGEALVYIPAGLTGYFAVPEGIRVLCNGALCSTQLSAIRFPSTLEYFQHDVIMDSTSIEWILFAGEEPFGVGMIDSEWATGLTAKVYYPGWMASWEDIYLDVMYCDFTYIPYEQGKEPVWEGETVEPENPFTDVPAGSFYEAPVMWAVENNITNGLSADNFGPDATCNRAQVVTFLWRAAGCPEPKSTTHSFVDVQAGSFYEKPVLWAVENGITTGSDATHFNPTGECNRAQVVTFMYRTFGSPAVTVEGLPFVDVPAGSWYEAPIAWAVANGVTNGLDSTHFGPTAICNRAQVVTFLYRAFVD